MADRKRDAWMPLYVGDYLRDTGDLSAAENGAYLLLIMHAWVRDGALPTEDERLRRLAKMELREWAASRQTILGFFHRAGDELRHKRVDLEIARTAALVDQKSAAGKASAAKRAAEREANATSNENPTPLPTAPQREPNPLPSPSPSPKQPRTSTKELSADADGDFERFYAAYPKKKAKGRARKAFAQAVKKTTLDAMLTAISRQQWGEEKYRPYPATWLNDECWLDVPSDMFDPTLRAAGLSPEDYLHDDDDEPPTRPNGGLLN